MVSNLLSEMQSCPKVEFQLSEQYGEDLSDNAWQYIFAIDLLCSRLKWHWTHDNVIRYCGNFLCGFFCGLFLCLMFVFFFQNLRHFDLASNIIKHCIDT